MDAKEFDKLLHDAEVKLSRLRALYEQFFQGIERLEPHVPRKDFDRTLELMRKNIPRNTALRFRFQQLVSRYTTYIAYWQRISRQIEDGTLVRDLRRARANTANAANRDGNIQSFDLVELEDDDLPGEKTNWAPPTLPPGAMPSPSPAMGKAPPVIPPSPPRIAPTQHLGVQNAPAQNLGAMSSASSSAQRPAAPASSPSQARAPLSPFAAPKARVAPPSTDMSNDPTRVVAVSPLLAKPASAKPIPAPHPPSNSARPGLGVPTRALPTPPLRSPNVGIPNVGIPNATIPSATIPRPRMPSVAGATPAPSFAPRGTASAAGNATAPISPLGSNAAQKLPSKPAPLKSPIAPIAVPSPNASGSRVAPPAPTAGLGALRTPPATRPVSREIPIHAMGEIKKAADGQD